MQWFIPKSTGLQSASHHSLFLSIPLTESAVSIFYKLEDFILVVKREYQDPIIVIPYCDVIPVRDPLRYPSGFHIGHCCRFCFRFLFSVDFTEMLSAAVILIHFRSQRKIKILGKCDHISMSPTAFPQTLKLACTEVNGKGPRSFPFFPQGNMGICQAVIRLPLFAPVPRSPERTEMHHPFEIHRSPFFFFQSSHESITVSSSSPQRSIPSVSSASEKRAAGSFFYFFIILIFFIILVSCQLFVSCLSALLSALCQYLCQYLCQ